MGIELAAAGAGASVVGGIISGNAQAGAARAERDEARRQRELVVAAAEPSPEELAQLRQGIELNEKEITRKQALLDSSDPALIEAGKQALAMLRGEEAKTLEPIKRKREEDRLRLEEALRNKLGSGFEESTAGSEALNDFDAETGSLMAVEQDRSLGRLLGTAANISSQGLTSNIGAAGTFAQLFGNIQSRRANALIGTDLTPFAGADFVGRANLGRTISGIGSSVTQGAVAGAVMGAAPLKFANLFGGAKGAAGAASAVGGAARITGGDVSALPLRNTFRPPAAF